MNFEELMVEASSVINVTAAIIAAAVALLSGIAIVAYRHRKRSK